MSAKENVNQRTIQAKVFDFAFAELVRQQRDTFQPLWSLDSWVKFLIWLALNCDLAGERESLELFVESLGSPLNSRMRRLFFERDLDSLSLHLKADPAESQVLIMSMHHGKSVTVDQAEKALQEVGLFERVEIDSNRWQVFDGMISIPWKSSDMNTCER